MASSTLFPKIHRNNMFPMMWRKPPCMNMAVKIVSQVEGSEPATVLVVSPVEVLMQCPRALKRSRIWDPSSYTDPSELASMDVVLADQIPGLTVEESVALGRASGDKPLW